MLNFRFSLLSKEPENERQQKTDDQAGDNRKMEAEIPFRVMNISRQAPKAALPDARPKQGANGGHYQSSDHQKSSQFAHDSIALSASLSKLSSIKVVP